MKCDRETGKCETGVCKPCVGSYIAIGVLATIMLSKLLA